MDDMRLWESAHALPHGRKPLAWRAEVGSQGLVAYVTHDGIHAYVRVDDKVLDAVVRIRSMPIDAWLGLDAQRRIDLLMSILKKIQSERSERKQAGSVRDPALADSNPALHEMLTAESYEDGKPRKTSTLLITVEEGGWKGRLNDRDGGQLLWVTSDCLKGVFDALEDALVAPNTPWRRDQFASPSHGKGSKK